MGLDNDIRNLSTRKTYWNMHWIEPTLVTKYGTSFRNPSFQQEKLLHDYFTINASDLSDRIGRWQEIKLKTTAKVSDDLSPDWMKESFQTYTTPKDTVKKEGVDFADHHLKEFLNLLDNGTSNQLNEWYHQLFETNRSGSLALLTRVQKELLCRASEDTKIFVKLLELLRTFDYEEIGDYGVVIATSALPLKGDEIKISVISLFDHWATEEVYHLLQKLEPPTSFLVKLQYEAVLNSLKGKYAVSQKN